MSRKKVLESQKRKLTNLKKYRKDKKVSQEKIAESLFIGQDTYSAYETGATPMPSDIVIKLHDIFGVSANYILDIDKYLNIGNKEIIEMTGLNEEAVENLRGYKEAYTEDVATAVIASEYGISHTPYNPISTLCMLINSPVFEPLLNAIENYLHPEYDKPMYYVVGGEEVGGNVARWADYHIPHNQVHKKPRRDSKGNVVYDNYIPLVKDESDPTNYRTIPVNKSFLDSAALLQIQRCLDDIREEYRK